MRSSAHAGVAQLVEQLICNHQVVSSSLITGSIFAISYGHSESGRFFVVATSLPSFFYHIGMIELVKSLRYATIRQLSDLLGEPKQNIAKRLRRLEEKKIIRHFTFDGYNVFTLDPRNPLFTRHELLVTDCLIRVRPTTCKRTGLTTNSDAWYEKQGDFWLEVETEDGHQSTKRLVDKARQYRGLKGRVHFDLPSEKSARKLCEAIKESDLHWGQYWISWRGLEAISPNGKTYHLGVPTYDTDSENYTLQTNLDLSKRISTL